MKLSLRAKFFLLLALFSLLFTSTFFLLTTISLKADFEQYLDDKQSRFAKPLILHLQNGFNHHQNWSWIDNWEALLNQQLAKTNIAPHEFQFNDGPPPHMWNQISLMGKDKRLIFGSQPSHHDTLYVALTNENQTVGFLAIPSNPALNNLQDIEFIEIQKKSLLIALIVVVFLSLIVSILISHLITRKIHKIINVVRKLSMGHYSIKMDVKTDDEIGELAHHIENLGLVLDRSNQSRREFVADISHELRTPLAVLKAELESIEDGVRPMDMAAVRRLHLQTNRLEHLVEDLYRLSISDVGAMTYKKHTIDIAECLDQTVQSLEIRFKVNNIKIVFTNSTRPIHILGDSNRLMQLFTALLKNSSDYTYPNGTVKIDLSTSHTECIISIEDSAPGVTNEQLPRLLERSYRADPKNLGSHSGLGLGLAISRNIIEAHQGTIRIDHSDLGGIKVVIYFPLAKYEHHDKNFDY